MPDFARIICANFFHVVRDVTPPQNDEIDPLDRLAPSAWCVPWRLWLLRSGSRATRSGLSGITVEDQCYVVGRANGRYVKVSLADCRPTCSSGDHVKGTSKTETDPEMQRHVQAAVAQRAISRSVPSASLSLSLHA